MTASPDWVPPLKSRRDIRPDDTTRKIAAALNVHEIKALNAIPSQMLIELLIPSPGASLLVGAPKSGKTVLAVHMAMATATGNPLFGKFRVDPGPALIVEQDDPSGAAGLKDIITRAGISDDVPLFVQPPLPWTIGPAFLDWLGNDVVKKSLRLVVLDSYTALRGDRVRGVDIVKAEHAEMHSLDRVAKQVGCAFVLIHHVSKGSARSDWSEKAAGTFAISGATEAQVLISRFAELDVAAPERLLRIRGRHTSGSEVLLRFCEETLGYECILQGPGASELPLLRDIERAFGTAIFTPKSLYLMTGVAKATAFRQIDRLYAAGLLEKCSRGEYTLKAEVRL
jgi:RecA-family ATPase